MKRLALYALSLFLLVAILGLENDAFAKKKKRKRRKAKTTQITSTTTSDSAKVVRAPGVPNRKEHDSLKQAKMIEKLKANNNAFVVSFISLSAGIDIKEAHKLEEEYKLFLHKNNCELLMETKNWGKEGERDYCFVSNDMDCLNKFVENVKLKFSNNRRILLKTNATCK